jgi:hypothetical protein
MIDIASLSNAARGIVLALTYNDTVLTYAELMRQSGSSKRALMYEVSELRDRGWVQLESTGNGREIGVRLTMPTSALTGSVFDVCVQADEANDENAQIKAIGLAVNDVIQPGSYTGKAPSLSNFKRWLREMGSAVAFYTTLDKARGNDVQAPINYIDTMVRRELRARSTGREQTYAKASHTEQKSNVSKFTPKSVETEEEAEAREIRDWLKVVAQSNGHMLPDAS